MFSCLLTLNKLGTQFFIASTLSNFIQVSADSMLVETALTYGVSVTVRHGHCE